MRFEWDDQQNESNLRKHGVDFDTAVFVFLDPWFVMEEGRAIDGEMRWRTIGEVDGEMLLLVILSLATMRMARRWRLDADVLAWLKKDGEGYQTRVNQMLRERMLAELKQG